MHDETIEGVWWLFLCLLRGQYFLEVFPHHKYESLDSVGHDRSPLASSFLPPKTTSSAALLLGCPNIGDGPENGPNFQTPGWMGGRGNRRHTATTIVNINPFTVWANPITISLSGRPLVVPKEIPRKY